MQLTLDTIIDTLKRDGVNSKGQVVKTLENANINDLERLRISIEERINLMVIERERK